MATLAAVPALALGGCGSGARTVRYRLTLEVETPEGVRSGASAMETVGQFNDGPLEGLGNAASFGTRGEAAVVDLGARGILFVLLTGDPARPRSGRPFGVFSELHRDLWSTNGIDAGAMDRMAKAQGPTIVPFSMLPMLVRFRDIADPKTVERVDPDDLAKSFGPGVRLKRATVEIADEAVTTAIEKWLRWLPQHYAQQLGGDRYPAIKGPLANQLSSGAFKAP